MKYVFNDDFRDFLQTLNDHHVRYILVGGYSVILHGYARTTGDMDIWVERTAENYKKLNRSFHSFGMPVFDMTEENFLYHPEWDVFTYGIPPVAIDVMIAMKGLDFQTAYERAITFKDGSLEIRTIHKDDLMMAKRMAGRSKDLNDLENLG